MILEDILQAGYEYRVRALAAGGTGFIIYGICKTADICLGRSRLYKKRYWYGKVLYRSFLFAVICMYLTYVTAVTLSGREAGSRVGYVKAGLFETLFVDGNIRIEALENVLLLMPLGVLMPAFFRWERTWKRTGLSALLLSFGIESLQLATGRGYFQMDDIVLNVLGALCGYFVFWRLATGGYSVATVSFLYLCGNRFFHTC